MADTESLGEAGVRFLEGLAATPEPERQVRVPTITDPRGIDFAVYQPAWAERVDGGAGTSGD